MSEETDRLDAMEKQLDAGDDLVEYLLQTANQIIAAQTAARFAILKRRTAISDDRIRDHIAAIQSDAKNNRPKRGRPRGSYAIKPIAPAENEKGQPEGQPL